MAIHFTAFSTGHEAAVADFNRRIAGATDEFQLREQAVPAGPPSGAPVREESFVALDGDAVRGGYILKSQSFAVGDETRTAAALRLPLSEGIADARYRMVGVQVIRDAIDRQPLLYALGMGGTERPLPQLLKALRWTLLLCPFYFRVVHPYRFLRQIAFLRRERRRRILLDTLAFSGMGWVGLTALQAWKARARPSAGVASATVEEFGAWADRLWEAARPAYSFAAVRSADVLNTLYPPQDPRFLRMQVTRNGRPVGWAVLLDTQMHCHKQFGNMRVGTVVDCLALPGEEAAVAAEAARLLEARKVDLLVANLLHQSWCDAFERAGCTKGPSNYALALAPALAAALKPLDESIRRMHMTRGDGDGPIHL